MRMSRIGAGVLTAGIVVLPLLVSGGVQAASHGEFQHVLLANGNGTGSSNGNGNGNPSGNGNPNGNGVPETPYAVMFPMAIGATAWLVYRKKSRQAS